MQNLKSTLVKLGALASDMSQTYTKLLVVFWKVNTLNVFPAFVPTEHLALLVADQTVAPST